MSDIITLTGLVATDPRHIVTTEGLPITTFRLASTQRRFDRTQEKWIDGDTNWYTITAFRQLATNSAASIKKGERVIVTGRLRIREWQSGERNGLNIDVEADAVGHDLLWGTSNFSRSISSSAAPAAEQEEEAEAAAEAGAGTLPSAKIDADAEGQANVGADDLQAMVALPF